MRQKENKNLKQGFTLLELLVVVVIIAILAAIALPQYKLAIEKSRIAQVLAATKSITQAQEIFYMTNNQYTDNIADLDIDVTAPKGWELTLFNDKTYRKVEFQRGNENTRVVIVSYYNNCASVCIHPGQIYCFAPTDYDFGKKLCENSAKTQGYTTTGGTRWIF